MFYWNVHYDHVIFHTTWGPISILFLAYDSTHVGRFGTILRINALVWSILHFGQ